MTASTKFLKLPLTLAVTSIALAACSTKPTYQPTIATTQPTSNQAVVVNQTAVVTKTADEYRPASDSGLDSETLAILNDLLEARDMSMVEGDQLSVQRYGNLWDRVRAGYKLSQPTFNNRIEAQKDWFTARQSYLDRLTARASRYLYHTVTEAERRGIPTELALLPIIESSYDPSATSNAAAAGLWQFIPSTGRIYGLNQTQNYDGRRDVIESTRAAYDFLTSLYNQFGSWELALAAYNAGPGRVQRAIDANRSAGLATDYWSLRLPTETMNYVPRFMAVSQIIGNPRQYGVSLPGIANHTHFRTVPVNFGTTLYDVANVTGVSLDELQLLNPALINFTVDASGPNRVVIPNSVPMNLDNNLKAIGGRTPPTPTQNTDYVAVNQPVRVNPTSTQELRQTNTLPTTTAALTSNNTISQEPPLSAEEVKFIAEQIKINSTEPTQVINPKDGKIDLSAVQTSQSVLDARGQKKTLQFESAPVARPTNTQTNRPTAPAVNPKPSGKQTVYVVKRGDSLGKIANEHGVTIKQLADWNQLNPNANLWVDTKLKIYDAKQAPASTKATQRSETYTVQSGDTLTGVASKYNMSVTQLANYNNLTTTSGLITGQTLWLVDGKVKSTKSQTQTQNNATTNYTVKSGDTLIGLAKDLGTTPEEIAKLNDFDSNAGLIQGRTIKVPATKSSKAQSGKNQSTKADTKIDTNQGRTLAKTENYKVKKGESLTSLASQYNVSVEDLAKTNNLSPKAGLRVGQVIKVPKLTDTYTVKSGDTLIGLARQYGVSTDELATMNNIKSTTQLKRGQKLTVPNR